MNFLSGKKTYIAVSIVVIHQILKVLGYDIDQSELSAAIDTGAGICAFFFRSIAKPKGK